MTVLDDSNGMFGDHHTGDELKTDWYNLFTSRFQTFDQPDRVDSRVREWATSKGLTSQDLLAFDARWGVHQGRLVVAYLFPGGIKYRTPTTPATRSTERGTRLDEPRMIRRTDPVGVIVAEGETDAMVLARTYPEWDIACMAGGAKNVSDQLLSALRGYQHVLVGLDRDAAGEGGSRELISALPAPPAGCSRPVTGRTGVTRPSSGPSMPTRWCMWIRRLPRCTRLGR